MQPNQHPDEPRRPGQGDRREEDAFLSWGEAVLRRAKILSEHIEARVRRVMGLTTLPDANGRTEGPPSGTA